MEIPTDGIRRIALQNAVRHGGRTQVGVVMAKLLGEMPEYRNKADAIKEAVAGVVSEVNAMTLARQKDELDDEYGGATASRSEPQAPGLPPLTGASAGVVTRFPPEPNGYPHIGHAKAAIINEEYAKMYGGTKILRMDDTNPESERLEYYAAIKVGLDWLGIRYDVIKNTSDDMELLYAKGRQMVEGSRAYVCTCKRDEISRNRRERIACRCSRADSGKGPDLWDRMFGRYRPGEAVLRYRGEISSENTAMRDPVLFRVVEARHPLTLDRYRVWPSYDFAVAVEDSADGVTHAFRSKEYELRNELYRAILDDLGMRKPQVLEFSRLEFEGMPVSKRLLRPLIEERKVSWYDDPRLPTLEAMRRRGIRPEAIRRFVISLGFTKADTTAPFEALEAFNRRIVDAESTRLHMVTGPKVLEVGGIPSPAVELANHPSGSMGSRSLAAGGPLLVPGQDASSLRPGQMVRLIGLGNIRIVGAGSRLTGEYAGDGEAGCPKVQWVPQDEAHRIRVLVPGPLFVDGRFNEGSLKELEAYTEPHYRDLADGAEVQFVRFGYCRKESLYRAIMTHR